MATIEEINAAFDAAETQVGETEGAEASAGVLISNLRGINAAQGTEIQSLKDQLAAGSPVTMAQLDALLARQNAITNRLKTSEDPLSAAVVA